MCYTEINGLCAQNMNTIRTTFIVNTFERAYVLQEKENPHFSQVVIQLLHPIFENE